MIQFLFFFSSEREKRSHQIFFGLNEYRELTFNFIKIESLSESNKSLPKIKQLISFGNTNMPICALQLPIVKIFKDYDKMSAKQQYESSHNINDGDDIETDDKQVTIKFVAASIDDQDGCNSSNETDLTSSKPRPLRQRKRSTSNIFHKTNKDLNSPDGSATLNSSSESIGIKRVNSPAGLHIDIAATPTRSCDSIGARDGLRKQLLRRSPSPSFLTRTPDREYSAYNGNPPLSPNMCPGYAQYQMSLLEVPMPFDYGDASSDDLSSEWDSDVQEPQRSPKVFISIFLRFHLNTSFQR